MTSADPSRADPIWPKVLAASAPFGRRVELHEHADGRLVIFWDGNEQSCYQRGSLDACLKAYLGLLQLPQAES